MLAFLLGVWASEPVVITAVVDAGVILAVSLGVPIPDSTRAAVDGLIVAIGVLIARSRVTPMAKANAAPPAPGA